MAKKKSSKKIPSSKENPFNVKVNRNKFSVLGQKAKGTRGLPGISRSISNAKRKDEFHKKRFLSQKSNKFVDKRFMDSSLSFDEQATVRMVEERKRKFKKNIFNLNDDESLTHKGIPLDNLKQLRDTINDSDDDDEHLNEKFVKEAHFGGFTADSSSVPKTRKEIIDDLIVESKRRKVERKMVKEKNDELIEQLDQKWKTMHHLLIPSLKNKQKTEPEKKDAFDILLNELKFEMRTAPPQREKTAEEIAREEKEKQKKLEEERNERMKNPLDLPESKDNQLSADSLYDGLDIQFEPVFEENEDFSKNVNEIDDDDDDDEGSEDAMSSEDENEQDYNNIKDKERISMLDIDSDFPNTVEKLSTLVSCQSSDLSLIVDKIIQDKIKSKSKQNIEMLETLFTVLFEYITNTKDTNSMHFEVLDDILPHFYTLAGVSSVNTAEKLLSFLDYEQDIFQNKKGKKMKKDFPRQQCLVLFKIISALYSVSDFKHPVVTPAITFMCDILYSPYALSFQNISTRLFISKIMYDCVSFSKRYVPEVLYFLNKTLKLALCNNKKFNLFVQNEENFEKSTDVSLQIDDNHCNDSKKLNIVSQVIQLLHQYAVLYEHFDSFKEIFHASINILGEIAMMENFSVYPSSLKNVIEDFQAFVKNIQKTYKPLTFENKKPIPLKLFEPAFDSKFSRKKDDIQKKRKLLKSVNQKIRKEERGQLRELRRDNQVIASEKLKEKLEADEERNSKVKQLYKELAVQEGEYKKFTKKK